MMLLCEFLIAMIVSAVMMSGAVVSTVAVKAAQNQTQARTRLLQIEQAEVTTALCALPANACSAAGVTPLIPQPTPPAAPVIQSGYSIFLTQSGSFWTATGNPIYTQAGLFSYYIDNSGVLRCGLFSDGAATASSPVCNQ